VTAPTDPVAVVIDVEPDDWHGVPAGIISRGVAFLLDLAVISLITAVVLWGVTTTIEVATRDATATPPEGAALFLGVAWMTVGFWYFTGGVWLFGRTMGKLALGLRVVRRDGTRPGFWRCALRTLCYPPSTVLLLGFALIALSKQRRSLPDLVARTAVVYDWAAHARMAAIDDAPPLPPRRLG